MGRGRAGLLAGSLLLTGTVALAPPALAGTVGLFGPWTATSPGSMPTSVAVGDVTGDGLRDVVVTTRGTNSGDPHDFSLFVYPGQPGGILGTPVQVPTDAGPNSWMGLALGDLDEDGDLDVAVTTQEGVQVFEQSGGTLTHTWTVPVADGNDVRLVDVSGDGLADLVVDAPDGIHVWWQIKGDLMPAPPGEVVGGSSYVSEVEVGDVTGDGLPDLVASTSKGVDVHPQRTDRSFGPAIAYPAGTPFPYDFANGLALADLNRDGRTDVALGVGDVKPNAWVVIRYQLPDGTLGTPVKLTSGDIPEAVEAGDLDGDGYPELVVTHAGWNDVGVVGTTPGTNPAEVLYGVPHADYYAPQSLALADVTGDGRADALVVDADNGLVLLPSLPAGADTTPPQTTITSGPSSTSTSRTATFSFASNEPGTFACSLDASGFTPCTSPATYTGLAQGTHRFQVRATDGAGNVDATAAAWSFTVEGPDTTITSGPTGTVRSTSATLAFTAAANAATYQCSLDNDAFSPCTSPVTYTGLSTGTMHAVRVRAIGADGLVDSTPATRSWTVDAAADLATTLAPSTTTAKKGGTLTWTTTVANTGPQSATGVTLTQVLPSGFTVTSVTAPPTSTQTTTPTCTAGGSPVTVRCTLGSTTSGTRWTVTVTGTVTAPKGSLASTATAATTAWDRVAANDSASAAVSVGNGR